MEENDHKANHRRQLQKTLTPNLATVVLHAIQDSLLYLVQSILHAPRIVLDSSAGHDDRLQSFDGGGSRLGVEVVPGNVDRQLVQRAVLELKYLGS
jgi:hypothetical protein